MTERLKVAPLLLVLAAGVVAAGSFQDTYSFIFGEYGPDQTTSTSLWGVTSRTSISMAGEPSALYAAGTPVVISAVLVVVAAVLLFLNKPVGRSLALVAAGALAGIVFFYVTQVLYEQEARDSLGSQYSSQLTFHAGTHLLVAGAVIGLVGAVLAQRRQRIQEPEEEEVVVVRRVGADDDTPPFGIERQQEES